MHSLIPFRVEKKKTRMKKVIKKYNEWIYFSFNLAKTFVVPVAKRKTNLVTVKTMETLIFLLHLVESDFYYPCFLVYLCGAFTPQSIAICLLYINIYLWPSGKKHRVRERWEVWNKYSFQDEHYKDKNWRHYKFYSRQSLDMNSRSEIKKDLFQNLF